LLSSPYPTKDRGVNLSCWARLGSILRYSSEYKEKGEKKKDN